MGNLTRSALIVLAAAMLAGCGGSQAPVTTAPVTATTQAADTRPAISFQTLHSFGSGHDGKSPESDLIEVNGTLYGTTPLGGSYERGTVYSISKTGTETVLHSFGSGSDGDSPGGGRLLDENGTLFGTTKFGGANDGGTIYTIDTTGNEKVLHSFDGANGAYPDGALISQSFLIGTTTSGGRYDKGIVYAKSENSFFRRAHDFGVGYDGAYPSAGLTDVNGELFGTTVRGGVADGGTVYALFSNGTEQVVHYFGSGSDGQYPFAGLLNVNGTLYGTTHDGGAHRKGTVYRIVRGVETVLHSFGGRPDGDGPVAGLTEMNGELYGTTDFGGAHNEGTIYRISTTGAETVLYSFGSDQNDGSHPYAGLLKVDDTLYGTTTSGGMAGSGTVFSLKP